MKKSLEHKTNTLTNLPAYIKELQFICHTRAVHISPNDGEITQIAKRTITLTDIHFYIKKI